MSDRLANPFTAPRVHFRSEVKIDHPKFGKITNTYFACRKFNASLRSTRDWANVSCARCLAKRYLYETKK